MSGTPNVREQKYNEYIFTGREGSGETQDQNLSQLEWQIFTKYQLFFSGYIMYIDFSYSCGGWWLKGEELGVLSSH